MALYHKSERHSIPYIIRTVNASGVGRDIQLSKLTAGYREGDPPGETGDGYLICYLAPLGLGLPIT
jgi:hypothetical protein